MIREVIPSIPDVIPARDTRPEVIPVGFTRGVMPAGDTRGDTISRYQRGYQQVIPAGDDRPEVMPVGYTRVVMPAGGTRGDTIR